MRLSKETLELIDTEQSIKRVNNDIKSDFIFAPHISAVFRTIGPKLANEIRANLEGDSYAPSLPIMVEVPKQNGFSRPGSILLPHDRLLYQMLVDSIAQKAEENLNRNVVYSNRLLHPDEDGLMFMPSNENYGLFKKGVTSLAESGNHSHVLKADVSCFFDRIYHHPLINLLHSAGCKEDLVGTLESLISEFRQRDSHGIIQGVFPSDFLGNFYLCAVDAMHEMNEIPCVRYVDDMYMFFSSSQDAEYHKIRLSEWLRADGLSLNESKSVTLTVEEVVREETELDRLFEEAKEEVKSQYSRVDFYESTIDWDYELEEDEEESIEEEELELLATRTLFDYEGGDRGTRSKIDKFCLQAFGRSNDSYAVDYALNHFPIEPHMAQVYARYLATMASNNLSVANSIQLLATKSVYLYDYQNI